MISVCIATYNGQEYIADQLKSILCQLKSDDEVLISDDNSIDDTLKIVQSFQDKRIIIYNNNFKSPIKNFEFLILQSKGDIIFLSDQDDIWVSNKVKKHLAAHYTDFKPKLVLSDLMLIDCYGKSINKNFYKKNLLISLILSW